MSDNANQVQAAAVAQKAEAVGAALKESVVTTWRAATTLGDRLILFGALIGLIAFLLPWVGAMGMSLSGWQIARNTSGALYALPASLGAVLFICYLNVQGTSQARIRRARWAMSIGAFWCGVAAVATAAGSSLFGVAAVGLYATLAGTAAIAAGAWVQIGDHAYRLGGR